MENRFLKRLSKKSKKGMRGWPMATLAFYGFGGVRATKVVASMIMYEGADAAPTKTWTSDTRDVRSDPAIAEEILGFIGDNGALSVVMADGLMGCPHQSGIDYEGDWCPDPRCTHWFRRDRFTGKMVE